MVVAISRLSLAYISTYVQYNTNDYKAKKLRKWTSIILKAEDFCSLSFASLSARKRPKVDGKPFMV